MTPDKIPIHFTTRTGKQASNKLPLPFTRRVGDGPWSQATTKVGENQRLRCGHNGADAGRCDLP